MLKIFKKLHTNNIKITVNTDIYLVDCICVTLQKRDDTGRLFAYQHSFNLFEIETMKKDIFEELLLDIIDCFLKEFKEKE